MLTPTPKKPPTPDRRDEAGTVAVSVTTTVGIGTVIANGKVPSATPTDMFFLDSRFRGNDGAVVADTDADDTTNAIVGTVVTTVDKVRFAQLSSLDTGSSPVWSAVADGDATDNTRDAVVGTVAIVGGGVGDGAVVTVDTDTDTDTVIDGTVTDIGTVKKRNFHTGLDPVSRTNNRRSRPNLTPPSPPPTRCAARNYFLWIPD